MPFFRPLASNVAMRYVAIVIVAISFIAVSLTFWDAPAARNFLPSAIADLAEQTLDVADQNAGPRRVEMEGLKMGEPFPSKQEVDKSDADFLTALLDELKDRFASIITDGDSPAYPSCTSDGSRYETLREGSRSIDSQTVSIAINLHNSQAIVPAQSRAILEAVAFLLPNHRVYISLFENGSNDKTKELLSDFAAALDALGADGISMHSSRFQTSGNEDRMTMLSEIRNHALRPLMSYAGSGTLIFMNDIATCTEDILELVYQRRLQNADVVIGTDWITLGDGTTTLYDLWATRGINGDLPFLMLGESGLRPFKTQDDWMKDYWITQTQAIHQRWLDGFPLPIYSGWGGMAAFDATLFTQQGLRFRSSRPAGWEGGTGSGSMGPWGKLVNEPSYLDGDCPGDSECKLIYRDIWNLREGKARIALAPRTRTVYNVAHWVAMDHLASMWSSTPKAQSAVGENNPELIDWDNVNTPWGVVCIASRTKDGAVVDAWGENNARQRLNPIFVKSPAKS